MRVTRILDIVEVSGRGDEERIRPMFTAEMMAAEADYAA